MTSKKAKNYWQSCLGRHVNGSLASGKQPGISSNENPTENLNTHGSMSRLFSDFLKQFEGSFWGCSGEIWAGMGLRTETSPGQMESATGSRAATRPLAARREVAILASAAGWASGS